MHPKLINLPLIGDAVGVRNLERDRRQLGHHAGFEAGLRREAAKESVQITHHLIRRGHFIDQLQPVKDPNVDVLIAITARTRRKNLP